MYVEGGFVQLYVMSLKDYQKMRLFCQKEMIRIYEAETMDVSYY